MISARPAWVMALVAALAATSAHAQHRESGDVYLGGALGFHVVPDGEEDLQKGLDAEFGSGVATASVDEGVVGWGVYGGFAMTDGLSLEVGYLGNADMDVALRGAALPPADGQFSWSAFYAAAVAGFPMPRGSKMYPFVKAGMARWEAESYIETLGIGFRGEADGTDVLFGAGVDVPGFGTWTFRGEYMFFWIDDDDGGHHHRFQAGINFTF